MAVELRPAEPRDAAALAALMDIASGGVAAWVWSLAAAGKCSVFEVGRARAMREEGGFAYRNATVATFEDEVVAMILGYRQPAHFDPAEAEHAPEPLRGIRELEQMAPDSFYLNAIAVFPDFRRQGIGGLMLDFSEKRAWRDGASSMSLIVASENEHGLALYNAKGYAEMARRPVIAVPGIVYGGEWILMMKTVSG